MKPLAVIMGLACVLNFAAPAADPQLTSWLTTYSGQYARVYETDSDRLSGTTLTTWPRPGRTVMGGQATPTYCGIHEISSSSGWVYLRTSGLGGHVMGPWFMTAAHTTLFMNMPKNTATIYRFPRSPQPQAGNKTLTGLGPIGIFVDGVVMFDSRDAFSVSASSGTEAPNGLGIWNRDAYVNESQTFDPAFAHQPGSGQYHYHANPPALRYLLGDNISFNGATKAYTEDSANTNLHHSPILGWVRDGYPIYGPYGYSNPTNPVGDVRRMISGFVPRNPITTGVLTRTTLPAWAQRAQNRPTLTAAQYGPAVSASFPMGRYLEDNDYLGDLGFTKGADFDLDEYNGRLCVTPEFPNGTYAYFTCISSNGAPVFPYNIGRQFYGVASGGTVASIAETVTTNFVGGPSMPIQLNSPSRNTASGDVTLTWSSVDGGTYQIEAASALPSTNWTAIRTNVPSKGILSDTVEPGPSQAGAMKRFYRVRRSGLAAYDATGF
ncbi:MAG TPA: YHYH protein [Verrucomicrobiae bacterium]